MPTNPRAASVRLKAAGKAALLAAWHDMRSGHVPAHIDAAAAGQNSVLQPPPDIDEIHSLAQSRFEAAQLERRAAGKKPRRKRPENASPAYTALITLGREAQGFLAALDPDRQDAALKAALAAVAGYLDVPVLWATVHRDESAIHLHAGLCAVRSNGLSISTATAGYSGDARRNTSELQDVLHQALQPHLPALERGTRLIDRLKAGERPERARSHHQLRRDLGLSPDARRNDVVAAVQELRAAQADTEGLRQQLAELEVRRNRIPHFNAAVGEIEAGRIRPLEARRQWKVEARTEATRGIEKCGFTRPEWAALRDWQGVHDRLREVKEATAKLEDAKRAAERAASDAEEAAQTAARRRAEIDGEIEATKTTLTETKAGLAKAELLELARQEIAAGRIVPRETPGRWGRARNFDLPRYQTLVQDFRQVPKIEGPLAGGAARAIWPEICQLAEMVSRQTRLPLFCAAVGEIEAGRMRPLDEYDREQNMLAKFTSRSNWGGYGGWTGYAELRRGKLDSELAEIDAAWDEIDAEEPWWEVNPPADADLKVRLGTHPPDSITARIMACRFPEAEWAELVDFARWHSRQEWAQHDAESAARRRSEAVAAMDEIEAELAKVELLDLARQEIEAGRIVPAETPGTWVQAGQYDQPRYQAVAGKITGAEARESWPEIRQLGEMVAARDRLQKAATELEAETAAVQLAQEEITAGNIVPRPEIGTWREGPNLTAERRQELKQDPRLRHNWRPSVWQRLRQFAAACTATVQDQLAGLQGRISKAMELARKAPRTEITTEIIKALDPPPAEPAATLFGPERAPESGPSTPAPGMSPGP